MKKLIISSFVILTIFVGCSVNQLNFATICKEAEDYKIGYANSLILMNVSFAKKVTQGKNIDYIKLQQENLIRIKDITKDEFLILLKYEIDKYKEKYVLNTSLEEISNQLYNATQNVQESNPIIILEISFLDEKNKIYNPFWEFHTYAIDGKTKLMMVYRKKIKELDFMYAMGFLGGSDNNDGYLEGLRSNILVMDKESLEIYRLFE